ncbi:radical SAM family heme chaperone HemW [Maricurvus nonylphenolicus]|uniref:radical SAM family heme chaperone HemW n=1 Tax=Maricurvus nonylphenolicus TaxID=1008307 RepID=UPI0036F2290D
MLSLPPLSLYVHIPWCVRKCPYCDFNSHVAGKELPEAEYLAALEADLQQELAYVQGRKLHSIFMGGGTPSIFSAQAIGQILTMAEKQIGFESDIEITLEANPGTFEQEKFSGYRQAGINRLSIGIQSFNDDHLQRLGRIHSHNEAVNAVAMARQAGFDNFNLDLMHGLPNQTAQQALADLQQAIDLQPEHISWYQLTIEPNTEFYSRPPTLPIDDELANIQDQGHQLLQDNGYAQYEISAYAKPQRQSRHNRNYWQFGDYLGIGAGAHGKVTLLEPQTMLRRQKTRLPQHYLDNNRDFCSASNPIPGDELALEFMMNGLRLINGVSTDLFSATTGLDLEVIREPVERLQQQGLLRSKEGLLATTREGNRYLNSVLQAFVL